MVNVMELEVAAADMVDRVDRVAVDTVVATVEIVEMVEMIHQSYWEAEHRGVNKAEELVDFDLDIDTNFAVDSETEVDIASSEMLAAYYQEKGWKQTQRKLWELADSCWEKQCQTS